MASLNFVTSAKGPQARTRLARAAVVDAARNLFHERGYGATTIDAISELAGVPTATVYRLFSTKHGILKALLDVSIAGDDDDAPVAERPHVRALLTEPDPWTVVAGFVANAGEVNARVAPIYRILTSAAAVDTEAAALLDELTRQRQQGQRAISRTLAKSGTLTPGVGEREAGDIIHALLSPELYRLLVVDRGWSGGRYARWLTALLAEQVLGSATATGPGS